MNMVIGTDVKRIHFVGLKGIAMAALATYCREHGYYVTGSDIDEIYPSDEVLSASHIKVYNGFHKVNIKKSNPDLVIYTGAHNGRNNVEVQTALINKIPVVPHGMALGGFMQQTLQVSVAGCHGKTTTASMIAAITIEANLDPSFVIGSGKIRGVGLPGHYGKGNIFIAEADEYVTDPQTDLTPRFLWQSPHILVITNIDYDHPDVYASLESVKVAYASLQSKVLQDGLIIINSDDKNSRYLKDEDHRVLLVGINPISDFTIKNQTFGESKTIFQLLYDGETVNISLSVPGAHNIQNAAMAAVAARELKISWETILKGLARFDGVKRRFELLGSVNGVLYFDDYAHHPNEIQATLAATRNRYPDRRVIAVFQPHTFSRTKALLHDFAKSFRFAHVTVITNIYGSAREKDTLNITGETLVNEIAKHEKNVYYAPNLPDVKLFLHKLVKSGDVVLFMGAGNIFTWESEILHNI